MVRRILAWAAAAAYMTCRTIRRWAVEPNGLPACAQRSAPHCYKTFYGKNGRKSGMADGSHAFSSKKLSGDGGCPWLLGGSTLDCIHQAPGRQHADLRRVLRDGGQPGPDMLCQAHARHIRPGTNLPEREGPVRLQPPGRPGRHNRRASGCKWAGLANAAGKGRLPGRGPVGNTHRFSATHGVPPTRRRPWPGGIRQSGCP